MALLCASLVLCFACSREQAAPSRQALGDTRQTPPMPLPGTSTPMVPEVIDAKSSEENPFPVFVKNCYLVDPEINPIGASESRERGIRMVTRGSIRNNSRRIIHRAGVHSKLVVNFGKNAKFEKHSGGLGFDPPVTSSNPWRSGTWRDFNVVGRAFDPIYREYEPKTITGILSLEARDPMGYRISEEVARMEIQWATLFGAVVDATIRTTESIVLKQGPYGYRTKIKEGEDVRLIAQQGAAYLALYKDRLAGWIEEKALNIPQYESLYPETPTRTFPMMATYEDRYQITVSDYRFQASVAGLEESPGGYLALLVKVKSLAQKSDQPVRPRYFWADQGSGRHASAVNPPKESTEALQKIDRLPPQAQIGGWVYIPRHEDGWPFALVFQTAPQQAPVHVFLLPAVSREGAIRSPGQDAAQP
jgi:hypothetical protein